MVCIIVGVVVIAVSLLTWFATRPLKIPREQTREGLLEGDAVTAYNRTSRWPIFALERWLMMRALARIKPEGALVDIGSGAGYLAAQIKRRYPALKVTGLDISTEMIAVSKRNWAQYDIDFVSGDAQNMPFPESSTDIAVSSLSLHH